MLKGQFHSKKSAKEWGDNCSYQIENVLSIYVFSSGWGWTCNCYRSYGRKEISVFFNHYLRSGASVIK